MRASRQLRGSCQVDVEVRCLKRPVHSGQKGGAVPDPVQILCRLIADLSVKDGSSLTVIAFEAQPILGSSNQILDSARARISMRTAPGTDSREAAHLLIRKLTRNPLHGARVQARISRRSG